MIIDLKYDFNAIAEIEDKYGTSIGAIFASGDIGFKVMRLLVWGGMLHNAPRTFTVKDAGKVISEYISEGGTLTELDALITQKLMESELFENFTQAEE